MGDEDSRVRGRMLHNVVEDNGKTLKENNLERDHQIPLDTLVEVQTEQEHKSDGIRLYVCKHTRDCDGTPLYSLSPEKGARFRHDDPLFVRSQLEHGWAERSLKVIELPEGNDG